MEALLQEITAGFEDPLDLLRVSFRLVAAVLLGSVIGLQREVTGAPAGLRTHMIVALGAALFVVVPPRIGIPPEDLSRVIQGIVTGIGFIGGGAILKRAAEGEVMGITTAAGLWLTTAVGVAAGVGRIGLATVAVLLCWLILSAVARFERTLATKLNGSR
jgi:putative Mg2+ transporter-C (MgtC) family protein